MYSNPYASYYHRMYDVTFYRKDNLMVLSINGHQRVMEYSTVSRKLKFHDVEKSFVDVNRLSSLYSPGNALGLFRKAYRYYGGGTLGNLLADQVIRTKTLVTNESVASLPNAQLLFVNKQLGYDGAKEYRVFAGGKRTYIHETGKSLLISHLHENFTLYRDQLDSSTSVHYDINYGSNDSNALPIDKYLEHLTGINDNYRKVITLDSDLYIHRSRELRVLEN